MQNVTRGNRHASDSGARIVFLDIPVRGRHAAVRMPRRDFYARTQLGACHNLLGLLVDAAGDFDGREGISSLSPWGEGLG